MEFEEDGVSIEKEPSKLDELVLDVTDVLDDLGVKYAVVSGYVAVLLGRSRATEDIDVITEPFSEATAAKLADRLRAAGYWGSAMPLDSMHEMLSEGSIIRVAEDGHRVPNVELKFATDRYDRGSVENAITIRLNDRELRAGELELDEKHARNREERLRFVREWAEYVRTHPDDVWGEQVNALVDSQIESARNVEDERPDTDRLREESPLLNRDDRENDENRERDD